MQIQLIEAHRFTLLPILLLGLLTLAGYICARRWPTSAWFTLVGIAALAVFVANEVFRVWHLPLHPLTRRAVTIEAVVAGALVITGSVLTLWAAASARRLGGTSAGQSS